MTTSARPIQSDASEKAATPDSGVGPSVANIVPLTPIQPRDESDNEVSQHPIRPVDRAARAFDFTFTFGPFRLLPAQRLLLEDEEPVRLGSRALEILLALVERPGELIGKRELMARVWPNLVVVEANLTVHIAALRRALRDGRTGNRYLINIPGQGYCFVAPVHVSSGQQPNFPATPPIDGADSSRIDNTLRILTSVAFALGLDIRTEKRAHELE